MTAAGICGSDVGIYHGTNAAATYPRIIGHEMVGVVAEIGSDVTHVKVGDRVIVNQVTSCGTCYPCRKNRGNVCDHWLPVVSTLMVGSVSLLQFQKVTVTSCLIPFLTRML